jgi:hypothetical protein
VSPSDQIRLAWLARPLIPTTTASQWFEYNSQNYTGWPMDMASVLSYAGEISTILAFLVMLPGACAASRKRAREHRRRAYRPRHARPRRDPHRRR